MTYLPVKTTGRIDLGELERAMTKETSLVSIMTVNNEIGVVQPMKEIGELCRSKKVLFLRTAHVCIKRIYPQKNESISGRGLLIQTVVRVRHLLANLGWVDYLTLICNVPPSA